MPERRPAVLWARAVRRQPDARWATVEHLFARLEDGSYAAACRPGLVPNFTSAGRYRPWRPRPAVPNRADSAVPCRRCMPAWRAGYGQAPHDEPPGGTPP